MSRTEHRSKPYKRGKGKWLRKHLMNRDRGICGICRLPITNMSEATIDHIRPESKGGLDNYENLQIAHEACNLAKGNTYDEEEGETL